MSERVIPTERPIEKPNPMLDQAPVTLDISEPTQAELDQEAQREADELLADMPTLIPPGALRIGQKADLYELILNSGALDKDGRVEVDSDDPKQMVKMLRSIAAVDTFAESIAVDKAAYRKWSEGKEFDVFAALLSRYGSALGK